MYVPSCGTPGRVSPEVGSASGGSGAALHCHVMVYDQVMDGRGRSTLTLTKGNCFSGTPPFVFGCDPSFRNVFCSVIVTVFLTALHGNLVLDAVQRIPRNTHSGRCEHGPEFTTDDQQPGRFAFTPTERRRYSFRFFGRSLCLCAPELP